MSGDITSLAEKYESYAKEVDESIKAHMARLRNEPQTEKRIELKKAIIMLRSAKADLKAQEAYLRNYREKERKTNYDEYHRDYGADYKNAGAKDYE